MIATTMLLYTELCSHTHTHTLKFYHALCSRIILSEHLSLSTFSRLNEKHAELEASSCGWLKNTRPDMDGSSHESQQTLLCCSSFDALFSTNTRSLLFLLFPLLCPCFFPSGMIAISNIREKSMLLKSLLGGAVKRCDEG